MIRAWFGIDNDPFSLENIVLLAQQQEILDTLKVHSQQGGLCLVLGEPGTGKTVIKETIRAKADKRTVVIAVNRTMPPTPIPSKSSATPFRSLSTASMSAGEKRLIEAVRARTKSISIDIVNKVLIQPHWRNDYDLMTGNEAL
jgi:type II secretory pathway predicted ATPase ExeA